jgi:tripeptidyl-peptidase-1
VLPCSAAEAAFATTIHRFRHQSLNTTLFRAVAPHSIPSTLASFVEYIGDMAGLPAPQHPIAAEVDPLAAPFPAEDTCNHKCAGSMVTPSVLTKAYKLGDSPKAAKGSMGVAEFQGVMWDQPALDKFSAACSLTPGINISNQIGNDAPKNCEIPVIGPQKCAEAMLDIEYIGAIGGAIPLTDIYSAQYSLFDWAGTLINLPKAEMPLVMSVSYGNDEKQQKSLAYMLQCNQQFMKFGALGVSVLFASGDQGVLGRSGPVGHVYHPDFPAASPYITAVGGTDFVTKGTIGPEKVWTQGGGGFSNTFGIPDFQASAVASYLKTAGSSLPDQSKWNATGRAYPDLAALGGEGNPYCIIVGGLFVGVAGTSAACPVAAGTFAKLNEIRLAKGGAPLGFLNPWIYKVGTAGFNDVTQGRNCGTGMCKDTDGFPAVVGWDAATGFGTPDFEKLQTFL